MIAGGRRYLVYPSRATELTLWILSDLHWLNTGVAEDRLYRDIAEIKADPGAFWFGGGDYADLIGTRDDRFDPVSMAHLSVAQLGDLGMVGMEQVRDLLLPIKHKCIGVLKGNHEDKYGIRSEQQRLVHWLSVELKTLYLGYSCFFDIVFSRASHCKVPRLLPVGTSLAEGTERWRLRVFAPHGRKKGPKINKLTDFMEQFQADLTAVAHLHDQAVIPSTRLRANEDCTKIIEVPQLGVLTGSYLRTYAQGEAGYGEKAGYPPVPLGGIKVRIIPHKRELTGMATVQFTETA